MAGALKILQWNARSIRTNEPFLSSHLKKEKFDILMLQSLNCKEQELPKMAGFCYPPFLDSAGDKIKVATYVNADLVATRKPFVHQAEGYCVWTEVWLQRGPINLLNMYFPTGDKNADWIPQVNTKGGTWIVAGDFNRHSNLWEDSCPPQNEATQFRDKILDSDLIILNDGSPTRIPDRAQQRLTAVDLTLTTIDIIDQTQWTVGEDPLSSDHLPITIELNKPPIRDTITKIKYNYEEADWYKFRTYLNNKEIDNIDNTELLNEKITNNILEAANYAIPQSKITASRRGNPWWTMTCDKAVKSKKKAYRTYRRHVCPENHKEMLTAKHNCKEIISQAKRAYWESHLYATDHKSNLTTLFKEVKQIKGQYVGCDPKLTDELGEYITAEEKANRLAQVFKNTSSFIGLPEDMQEKRRKEERIPLTDPPVDDELKINSHITMDELNKALANITRIKVSEGPDALSYRMLKELPLYYKKNILELFQRCWTYGEIPKVWKQAIIIPILKPGKEKKNPNNYRPISLTSHLGKIYEKIIKTRLNYYCEGKNVIPKCQAGFMRGRGVSDHLAKFSAKIRRARARRKLLFTVFFDVRRAYDTVWHRKILQKLKIIGLSGNIYNFVKSFLGNRKFRVKWKDKQSDEQSTEMGVPQGSVIAPLLFNLVMADIEKIQLPKCTLMIYADDVAICYETTLRRLTNTERNPRYKVNLGIFQSQIDNVNFFMKQQGFTLEPTKTQFMIFKAPGTSIGPNVTIEVDGVAISHITQAKYLGVIFSASYSWQPHITALITSTHRAINLIKLLKGLPWASQPKNLVNATTALVRSRLIYGHEAFFEAPEGLIDKLEACSGTASYRFIPGHVARSPHR